MYSEIPVNPLAALDNGIRSSYKGVDPNAARNSTNEDCKEWMKIW